MIAGKGLESQSPQIGSMFPTRGFSFQVATRDEMCRNPLKSGQCFLHGKNIAPIFKCVDGTVAIPSNRVNVSYEGYIQSFKSLLPGRNPLKSGQCFLQNSKVEIERL